HLVAGRQLDVELGHPGDRDVAGRDGAEIRRILGLHPVDVEERPQLQIAAVRRHGRHLAWEVSVARAGRTEDRSPCGRGMTWTETRSPTRLAAAAPASVAALTAPTSPRTIT